MAKHLEQILEVKKKVTVVFIDVRDLQKGCNHVKSILIMVLTSVEEPELVPVEPKLFKTWSWS